MPPGVGGLGRRDQGGMGSVSVAGRIAAVLAVVVAVVVVAVLLFAGGGGGYTVKAEFQNASQLVEGQPRPGRRRQGRHGREDRADPRRPGARHDPDRRGLRPAQVGTRATIRQASLSGIANRYVDLTLPATPRDGPKLRGDRARATRSAPTTRRPPSSSTSCSTSSTRTRASRSSQLFVNSHQQYEGKTDAAARGVPLPEPGALHLEPPVQRAQRRHARRSSASSSTRPSSSTALAERRDDLSALVGNLNATFRALGNERVALAEAINALPDFMRQANTTFVDLRFTLDDGRPAGRGVEAGRRASSGRSCTSSARSPATPARPSAT